MTSSPRSVIGLGELLWDCFPDRRTPGGAPANFAFHARQLGLAATVASRVGTDELGAALLTHLADHGLTTELVQRDARHPTGTVTAHADRSAGPAYTIHEQVAWDFLEWTSAWQVAFQQVRAVCFGTLAQRSEQNRATIHRALRELPADALVIYDINLRPPAVDRAWIEASLAVTDIVKLNDDEVRVLSPWWNVRNEAAFARELLARFSRPRLVCITKGAAGCELVSRDERVLEAAPPVAVVDTVGAGDAFTAGLLFAQLRQWSLRTTAKLANGVGGLVAGRSGAMPTLKREFAELIEQLPSETNFA